MGLNSKGGVSLPADLPACLAPTRVPTYGEAPYHQTGSAGGSSPVQGFEGRGPRAGTAEPWGALHPTTQLCQTLSKSRPVPGEARVPPDSYTLRTPAGTLQWPPATSRLLKGTGLCHPLWDWAFCPLVRVLAGQITPLFHPPCLPEWQQRHLSGHAGHRYLGCQHLDSFR